MIRRRLFAYTVMYASGILAGYLLCEKARLLYSAILLISVGIIICRINLESNNDNKYKKILFTMLLIGTSMFIISYIYLHANLDTSNINCVEGKVIRVQSSQTGIQFTIEPDCKEYGNRLLVNYYAERSDEDNQDNIDNQDDQHNNYERYIGRKYRFSGSMKLPSSQMNPGCFDYALYLKSLGVKYCFTAKTISIIDSYTPNVLDKYRSNIMRARTDFLKYFKGEVKALIKGMLFGDKNEIDEKTREEFNENGTGHILAVSGLHIGFLFTLLRLATKKRRTIGVYIAIVAIVLMYGEMTQWSASTVRAVLVMSISLFSMQLRRAFDLLSSVSLAALILLIYNPYMLFNSGFQMSFLAMLGIAFLSKPLSFIVGDYLAMLLAVQLSVFPYTAYTFNRINPISIVVNIPIVAIAGILVPVCIIGVSLSSTISAMPTLLTDYINAGCTLLLKVNNTLNLDGSMSFQIRSINVGLLIFLYLIMFLMASEWTRIKLIRRDYCEIKTAGKYIGIISIILIAAMFNTFIDDEIVFVNVGQGDCTHIRCGNTNVLIDGGGKSEFYADYNTGEKILEPYLLKNGVSRLDAAYLTHLHSDHYRGIEELNEIFPIGYIGISNQYKGTEDLPDNTVFFDSNSVIKLSDNFTITSIWPRGESARTNIDSSNDNELNTVYIINYYGIKIMITGDLLEDDELKMIEYYKNTDVLDCDVLKIGHHGSKSSTSVEFLDAVSPDIAVISVGENNMYGHPSQQTLDRLNAENIKIYRTDQDGAIGLDIRGTLFDCPKVFAHCCKSIN